MLDPEKDLFFEANNLTELKDYDEIYLDSSLFPNMWQLRRGIISIDERVDYFTRPGSRRRFEKNSEKS